MEAEWKDTFLKGKVLDLVFSKSRQLEIQSSGEKAVGGLSVNRQIDQEIQSVN